MQFPDTALDSPAGREAIRIIDRLREAGFVSVLAGGCVRDALLGRTPKDFDVATDATPDSVQKVFGRRQTVAFGASFGVIGVLPPKPPKSNTAAGIENELEGAPPTEVATFRADGNYSDGRRPDHVTYGTAEADAARRDFTINGLFYDPARREILDYVGGIADLESMHLRTIGEADRRFEEDKLRMLRAIRFVTTLSLSVEQATMSAIVAHSDTISMVSGERVGAEMRRVVGHPNVARGLRLLVKTGLHRHVWPTLENAQWPLLQTRLEQLENTTFESGIAATLLTLHPSSRAARNDLKTLTQQWKLSTAEQRAITAAIKLAPEIVNCADKAWSALQPILIDRDIETIIATAVAIADDDSGVRRAMKERERTPSSLDPQPLLTGDDLIKSGIKPGPQFREWLSTIRQMQLDDQMHSPEEAMSWVLGQPNA
ncbi:CCA tRNA nucleotidyltransferase [Rhodopirellula sp. SWK7]|uniref:CCA tRNA nucleotidyltransferase n=1 Tax=Rhodopirellula sp. SWK7 TaxID=595460 RepID=UPI0002BD4A32|nr:CCA tRNA nucleotidyltransferase [Rhodopirellula sp. SWK7]EMI44714.1 tRNA adenylyltransferase [Rhodopirellula sp. SWK7]